MTVETAEIGDEAVDPELVAIVRAQRARALQRPPLASVTPAQMRRRAAEEFAPWNHEPEPVAQVRDFLAAGVPVRLYDPAPGAAAGTLLYLHGGGWVIGDLDFEDAALRRIAGRSGQQIISIAYRLAPEHRCPAALDDVEAVVRWAASDPSEAAIDPARIALGGASAGANLALGCALRLRDRGGPLPCFLLLMYGAYGGGAETQSSRLFGDGRFGLPKAAMDWFWKVYAGRADDADLDYAIPLRADLADLPPVFVNYAELDILRDDSLALVKRLRAAGTRVQHRAYPGAVHGFTQYAKASALARRALDDAADALVNALA